MAESSQLPTSATDAQALIARRYRIEDILGKGGVGEVLRVTDISSGRALALKRLRSHALPDLQSPFEREYQI